MITVIKNFNKEDCRYFKWTFGRACCGRGCTKSGACAVPLDNQGAQLTIINKVCSTSLHYCKYEKKET
jgi:hypothetical protein